MLYEVITDGLEIKKIIEEKNSASLHLFFNPDFVAHFSSRGPVSPFYIKPDLVRNNFV